MSLIEDPQNKAHKLNYLFSYLIITLVTLGHVIISLQKHPFNPTTHKEKPN